MSRMTHQPEAAHDRIERARSNDQNVPHDEENRSFAEERSSLWLITASPLVWAIHFVLCYGGAALYCAKFGTMLEPVPFLRESIGVLTLLALAIIGFVGWRSWTQWDFLDDYDYAHEKAIGEDRHEFLGHAAFLLSVMSAIAVIYVALPAVALETCR